MIDKLALIVVMRSCRRWAMREVIRVVDRLECELMNDMIGMIDNR